jgi:hypothetical protein
VLRPLLLLANENQISTERERYLTRYEGKLK